MKIFLAILLLCIVGCAVKPVELGLAATINGKPVTKGQTVALSLKDEMKLDMQVVGLKPDANGMTGINITLGEGTSFSSTNNTETTFSHSVTITDLRPGVHEQVLKATDTVSGKSAEMTFSVEVK